MQWQIHPNGRGREVRVLKRDVSLCGVIVTQKRPRAQEALGHERPPSYSLRTLTSPKMETGLMCQYLPSVLGHDSICNSAVSARIVSRMPRSIVVGLRMKFNERPVISYPQPVQRVL